MRIHQLLLQPRLQARAFYREPSVQQLHQCRADDERTLAGAAADPPVSDTEAAGAGPEPEAENDTPVALQENTAAPSPGTDEKELRPCLDPKGEYFLVNWAPGEKSNPQNWSASQKWGVTFSVAAIATVVSMASSIDSAGVQYSSRRYGVGVQTAELQTALFLVGFGVSAPVFAPLSEITGRVPVYCFTLLAFALFEMGAALAQNIQARVIPRFFAGFWGSSPLANAGGSVADLVNARSRTVYFAIFSLSGLLGPALGPVIGGYLAMDAEQQWCDWVMALTSFALTAGLVLFMRETYGPVLLKDKARAIRELTGDARYMTALERERMDIPFSKAFRTAMVKPFAYLIYEPIVFVFSVAMSLVYCVFFGFLEGQAETFSGWNINAGKVGLTFLALCVGLAFALVPLPWVYKRYVRREEEAQAHLAELKTTSVLDDEISPLAGQPPPEERLIHVIFGTWFMVAGLFWQGWASLLAPRGSPWPAIAALAFVGIGILAWFISSYQYIIDVYGTGSASALSTLTTVRYPIAGGATMFSRPMYRNLRTFTHTLNTLVGRPLNHSCIDPQWALTLLGSLTFVFSFIPIGFYIWGPLIRSWSRYART